jgi:hypothetical protein
MAVDIRAVVTCSLGDLISGNISDDYIQSNGLIKTKGSVELKGVLTPVVGTAVTFSYSRDGITTTVPRKLRVLSSFADPFRQVTKVELGCMLVYKADVTPAPTVDGLAAETSGRQQQCLNGYRDYPSNSVVTIPVNAAGVMQMCLTKLGITASSIPLTNRFNTEKFDLSAGYVQVLADLLYSESFIGYLDSNEVLQVRDLIAEGGKGPVIDTTNLIDLDAIGVGGLPGEAVVVRYNSLKLSGDVDVTDQGDDKKRNWEEEEVTGSPQNVEVRYTTTTGGSAVNVFTFVPYSRTETTYGTDASWDNTTCVISSLRGEGADLSNRVVSRKTTQRTILAESANSYCAQLLSAGFPVAGETEGTITRSESYQYDNKGELTEQISEVYEPFFKWAGGLGVDFVYDGSYVSFGSGNVLVERTVVTYSNIYAKRLGFVSLKPGETYERAVEGQKVTTTVYQNWALTAGGQQGTASIKELAPFETAKALSAWLDNVSLVLVMVDSQVRTQTGRGGVAGQVRPPRALRTGQATGTVVESTAQLAYAMGSASAERFVSFSMPYQSDDVHTAAGFIVKGDAEAKALRFGRIQNRLLLGNRNGVNLQVHPSKMPAAPFDPLYLSDGSLMVQYRANATNWAFGPSGIVCSVDALFWGVAGGTGTAWVPVAPGITTFPPLPAVDAGGDSTVDAVVPPWNEIVSLRGVTRTLLVARDYAYAIGGSTETAAVVTHTRVAVGYRLAADAGSFVLTGAAQPIKLRAGVGAFVLDGLPAGSIGNRVWRIEGTAFNVVGQDATKRRTYAALTAEGGSFVLDGQVAGKFKGTAMQADGTTFLVTGADAGSKLMKVLTAEAGTFTLIGQAATLTLPPPTDPYASSVVLLLHMDGTNNSTTFTDYSLSARTLTAQGNAKISTAQSKFGGASGLFDGSGDYLSIADSNDFDFGSGDFTIECWFYRPSNTFVNFQDILTQRNQDSSNYAFSFYIRPQDNTIAFRYSTSGNGATGTVGADNNFTITNSVWHHFAITRSSGTFRLFVNGTVVTTSTPATNPTFFNSTAAITVGAAANGAQSINGYLDDLRVTKGVARYTANFTPPTAAFPNP